MATSIDYQTLYQELEARWPVVAITAVTLLAALIVPGLLKNDPLASIPEVGRGQKDFMKRGGWQVYTEGYNKFKDGIFRITTMRSEREIFQARNTANIDLESQSVVISPKFLDELKRLPDDVLSFSKAVDEVS